jgi:hypothetical protein
VSFGYAPFSFYHHFFSRSAWPAFIYAHLQVALLDFTFFGHCICLIVRTAQMSNFVARVKAALQAAQYSAPLVLLGPAVEKVPDYGRLNLFLLFALNLPALLLRLTLTLVVTSGLYIIGGQFADMATVQASFQLVGKLSFLAAEIYLALILIRSVAWIVGRAKPLLIAIVAMWLPILVIIVSIIGLFVSDQGQEIGVGLMNPYDYLKAPFLAVILVYWALNGWLAARLGLARYFPRPKKEQGYLFWGPRFIGVCAHFIAALSLSIAMYSHPDPATGVDVILVISAPGIVLLATIFAWSADWAWISERFEGTRHWAVWALMYLSGIAAFVLWCWLIWRALTAVSAASPEAGLCWTAVCIGFSAIVFLGVLVKMRRAPPLSEKADLGLRATDDGKEWRLTLVCALTLGGLMIAGTAAIWAYPMQIGQFFGSLSIACFAFGSFLAFANLLDLASAALAAYVRKFNFRVRPRALVGMLLALAIVPTVIISFLQPAHKVRLCDGQCADPAELKLASVQSLDDRPDVSRAAQAWYVQAAKAYHSIYPKTAPVPMLIVATAGGGIRAAYWTATVLETLDNTLIREKSEKDNVEALNLMRSLLFGISGVSGGSVGASAYAAAVREHEEHGANVSPTNFLKEDFLAPGLAAMIFIDGLANLLPDMGQIDRGEALERGFETASKTKTDQNGLLSHKFLNFSPPCKFVETPSIDDCKTWRPLLLLNATHQETGRRIITSHVKIERDSFFDSYDALHVLNSDVRLSTAAHNSARFSYVSPAGNLISATAPTRNRGYILDGGYYENYGAATALELARKALQAIDPNNGRPGNQDKVKLVILQISSDPTLEDNRTLVRAQRGSDGCAVTTLQSDGSSTNYLALKDAEGSKRNEGEFWVLPSANELTAPVAGIMSVRGAHGTVAAEELAAALCQKTEAKALNNKALIQAVSSAADSNSNTGGTEILGQSHFAHLAMCEGSHITPPLGWVLSDHTRLQFARLLNECGNEAELDGLKAALGWPLPQAPTK